MVWLNQDLRHYDTTSDAVSEENHDEEMRLIFGDSDSEDEDRILNAIFEFPPQQEPIILPIEQVNISKLNNIISSSSFILQELAVTSEPPSTFEPSNQSIQVILRYCANVK